MTAAQRRLLDTIARYGDDADYWPVVNDWVKDRGAIQPLALRNILATVDACIRQGLVTIADDGRFELTPHARAILTPQQRVQAQPCVI